MLAAVAKAVKTFGGIDIPVNNASAISMTDTKRTPMQRYDLKDICFAPFRAALPVD